MPIYDYLCKRCGERFEVFKYLNDPEPKCPKCGSSEVVKVFSSSVYFKFVGSGFYENDYKNKK